MKKAVSTYWSLNGAVEMVRFLEPSLVELGAHVGLTGSTLFKGESWKDLDLIVYPDQKGVVWDVEPLVRALDRLLSTELKRTPWASSAYALEDDPIPSSSDDLKMVYWGRMPDGRRVDVFFLS